MRETALKLDLELATPRELEVATNGRFTARQLQRMGRQGLFPPGVTTYPGGRILFIVPAFVEWIKSGGTKLRGDGRRKPKLVVGVAGGVGDGVGASSPAA